MTKHLWEADHAYYCNEGNFFANSHQLDAGEYDTFEGFLEEEGDSDMDYNLLFRWDWIEEDPETGESTFNGDEHHRNGQLKLFWMGQRKGLYRWSVIDVCRADEPAVIAFLKPRLAHLMSLWAPLVEENLS